MSKPERRRDSRIQTAFEVLNVYPPLEGIALLRDLSAHGACIEGTSARPEIGKDVRLSVRVTDKDSSWVLVAKVVRHVEQGFAVEFEKPEAQVGGLIAEEGAIQTSLSRVGSSPYREIAMHCCANGQWLSGRICTPPNRRLLDHLNQGEAFVRVVGAVLAQRAAPIEFLALRTDALDLVFPVDPADVGTEQRVGRVVERPVQCLLPSATLEGTIGVLGKIRISDHLLRCSAFVAVRDCRIQLANGQPAPRDLSLVPVALVNVRRVIGISDLAATPLPEEPSS